MSGEELGKRVKGLKVVFYREKDFDFHKKNCKSVSQPSSKPAANSISLLKVTQNISTLIESH